VKLRKLPALTLLMVMTALGCSGEKERLQRARTLLERISKLDPNAPAALRRAQLEAIAAMPLVAKEAIAVRELCLGAHRGLLAAEVAQAQARTRLDTMDRGRRDGGIAAALEAQQVAELIGKSNQALAKAQRALPECERSSRQLLIETR